ncbi:hypothetical protein M3B90_08030 [Dermabacter sp. p3-SID358]|uniref:hypothetical protein n=1 Tax=Dermabacter sp. p3-SID358 TaxID=2916114 RepID=UPI0021A94CF5|nr:hypothetical protein [Dermabacter sp. p3-SID358]MCT1867473.1 hypothetical protein [Dermabacter sp. p3-SID358]
MRESTTRRKHPCSVLITERIHTIRRIQTTIFRVFGAGGVLFAVEVTDAVGFVKLGKNMCFDCFSQFRNPRE